MARARIRARDIPDRLEDMVEENILDNVDSFQSGMVGPLLRRIREATGPDAMQDLLRSLPDAFDEMDGGAVERIAERTHVAADLIGRTSAEPREPIKPKEPDDGQAN